MRRTGGGQYFQSSTLWTIQPYFRMPNAMKISLWVYFTSNCTNSCWTEWRIFSFRLSSLEQKTKWVDKWPISPFMAVARMRVHTRVHTHTHTKRGRGRGGGVIFSFSLSYLQMHITFSPRTASLTGTSCQPISLIPLYLAIASPISEMAAEA